MILKFTRVMLFKKSKLFFTFISLLFILSDRPGNLQAGQLLADSLFQYYPATPRLIAGDTLFVIENGAMNNAERLLISTLSGVVAQKKPHIFIRLGAGYLQWLDDLQSRYGLVLDDTFQNDPWGLLTHFKADLADSAYLLCQLGQSSMNVATSLAGILGAVAVDESIESRAIAAGLHLKMDVRGKDESWCFQNYWPQCNHGLLIQQKESVYGLRDYGPLTKAFTFFDGNSAFMRQVMDAADDDSPLLGWGDASQGEDKFVRAGSENSVFTVASDHAWNLSVFSALKMDSLYQRAHVDEQAPAPTVHTVTFIMSDGDNIQWLMNDFSTNEKWFASPLRGQFNMGWTVSPSMVALAPTILDRLYRDASTGPGQDFFVCGVSGGGYLYPSYFPALSTHCERLNAYLKAADLNIVTILERRRGYFTPKVLDSYTRQSQIIGCFYMDYGQYDYYAGKMIWSNGKPVVSAKFNLWENFDSPESIARWINLLPKDPANPASYSFINVHPWSRSLEDVQRTINLFNEHVQVVTPEGFIKRIIANVPHAPAKVLKNHSLPGKEKLEINVYPNPTGIGQTNGVGETQIRLQAFNNTLPQHLRIVDILGRTVREWQFSGLFGKRVLDLSWNGYNQDGVPVPAGIYFVQAFQKTSVQTRKFIITRN